MNKKIKLLIIFFLISITTVKASTNNFSFNTSTLSFTKNTKKDNITNNFKKEYNLTYSISSKDKELEEKIKNLTKKSIYLLFGSENNTNESSEEFYKRKKDWYDLRYNPKVPKSNNNSLGVDTESQEYKDDIVSGLAIPQMFSQANELGLIYNSFGNIRITINDNLIISTIVLPNVKIKKQSKEDPMKYNYIETNFITHFYYKKLKDEWKIYYLYGETSDDISQYLNEVENKESKLMAIAPSYKSKISTIYNFEKLEKITEEQINNIYTNNTKSIVFLNSYYNNKLVASANGFFINKGLIVTTWSFLEKSLINGQYITSSGFNKPYEIEGIVTANPDIDIVVIKVKNNDNYSINLGDYKSLKKEDPIFTISSKSGIGNSIQKGIIISNKDYIQTSIPLANSDEGSPLINKEGQVVGINTSKSTNSSISIAINSDALKEIQNKFNNIEHNKIQSIPFDKLKEKYYYTKTNKEYINNNIPKNKWKEYSKIGNIEETIKLELIKANYKDNLISLRYKNILSQYITGIQLASSFKEKLLKEGFKEILKSNSKCIYKNNKYQVIIMDEFDYLIIVMVKL